MSTLVKDNQGHGFLNENNRFDFYRAMEKFFSEHLAVKKLKTNRINALGASISEQN